jgi:hypothetical protein
MTVKSSDAGKILRRYDVAINALLPTLMLKGWECRRSGQPVPGDIVILTSAPPSEWDLSIYRGFEEPEGFAGSHLVESMRTGVVGRWSNIGFHVINREVVFFPQSVSWTDEQFAFEDKFRKVYKKADFYMAVPYIDKFDGDAVHIIFRTRLGFDKILTPVTVNGWPKITQKALLAQLLEAEAIHKQKAAQP